MAKDKVSDGGATIEGAAQEVKKKKSASPLEFIQQAIAEARKVTWTSRNETLISTVMVLIMVAIMAIFFLAIDSVIRILVNAIFSFN